MKKILTIVSACVLITLLVFFVGKFNTQDNFSTQSTTSQDEYDLALSKTVSNTTPWPYYAWDEVMFHLTVYNQGTVDSWNVTVTDYVPTWLTFVSASITSTLQWWNIVFPLVNLAPWAQEIIQVTYRIDDNFPWWSLSNYAEISSDSWDDIDSTPDQDMDNDCLENDEISKLWCVI